MRRCFVVVEVISRKSCLLRELVLHSPLCRDPRQQQGHPRPRCYQRPPCYQRPLTASARLFSSSSNTFQFHSELLKKSVTFPRSVHLSPCANPKVQQLCSPHRAGFLTGIVVLEVFLLPDVCGCTKWFQLDSGGSK